MRRSLARIHSREDIERWALRVRGAFELADVFAGPKLTFLELLLQKEYEKAYQREFLLELLTERFGCDRSQPCRPG